MEGLLSLLTGAAGLNVLQVFVGGIGMTLCTYMVLQAGKDKKAAAAPAPAGLDTPGIHVQGPAVMLDLLRETRDYGRQSCEYLSRVAECSRISRDHTTAQTEILREIRDEARVEQRVLAARRDAH